MLNIVEVDRLATQAASKALKRVGIVRVFSAPTVTWDGDEALSVTIVLRRNGGAVTGREANTALVEISQELERRGDSRFPITTITTEEEQESHDDSQP